MFCSVCPARTSFLSGMSIGPYLTLYSYSIHRGQPEVCPVLLVCPQTRNLVSLGPRPASRVRTLVARPWWYLSCTPDQWHLLHSIICCILYSSSLLTDYRNYPHGPPNFGMVCFHFSFVFSFRAYLTLGLQSIFLFHGMHRPTDSHPAREVWMLTRTLQ